MLKETADNEDIAETIRDLQKMDQLMKVPEEIESRDLLSSNRRFDQPEIEGPADLRDK